MDIFSNRAGVELLRPTVYLKQITPGLQIPEEVKKAMIQKARKDMLENGNQIKKTIKPGYTMPHATTMAELELNKKRRDTHRRDSDNYYTAGSRSGHVETAPDIIATIPGLRLGDLAERDKLAIFSPVYRIIKETLNQDTENRHIRKYPKLPREVAMNLLASELILLPGVVPQLACLLRLLCGDGEKGLRAAVTVLTDYLLYRIGCGKEGTPFSNSVQHLGGIASDYAILNLGFLRLFGLSAVCAIEPFGNLANTLYATHNRSTSLAFFRDPQNTIDVNNRDLAHATTSCMSMAKFTEPGVLCPDALALCYNMAAPLAIGEPGPYSSTGLNTNVTTRLTMETEEVVAVFNAIKLCPALAPEIIKAIKWAPGEDALAKLVNTTRIFSANTIGALIPYLLRLNVMYKALSCPELNIREVCEKPHYRMPGRLYRQRKLEQIISGIAAGAMIYPMLIKEFLTSPIKTMKCLSSEESVNWANWLYTAKGLLGKECFDYPWMYSYENIKAHYLGTNQSAGATHWNIYSSLSILLSTMILGTTVRGTALLPGITSILLRPIQHLSLGNPEFTDIYWDLWDILENSPQGKELIAYTGELLQNFANRKPTGDVQLLLDFAKDSEGIDFKYLENRYLKDMEKSVNQYVKPMMAKFQAGSFMANLCNSVHANSRDGADILADTLWVDGEKDDPEDIFGVFAGIDGYKLEEYEVPSGELRTRIVNTAYNTRQMWGATKFGAICTGIMGGDMTRLNSFILHLTNVCNWNEYDWQSLWTYAHLWTAQCASPASVNYRSVYKPFADMVLDGCSVNNFNNLYKDAHGMYKKYVCGCIKIAPSHNSCVLPGKKKKLVLPDDRVEAEKLVGNKRNLTPTDVLLKLWARTGVFIGNYIGWGKDNSNPDIKGKTRTASNVLCNTPLRVLIGYLKYFWDTHANKSNAQLIKEARKYKIDTYDVHKIALIGTSDDNYESYIDKCKAYKSELIKRESAWRAWADQFLAEYNGEYAIATREEVVHLCTTSQSLTKNEAYVLAYFNDITAKEKRSRSMFNSLSAATRKEYTFTMLLCGYMPIVRHSRGNERPEIVGWIDTKAKARDINSHYSMCVLDNIHSQFKEDCRRRLSIFKK